MKKSANPKRVILAVDLKAEEPKLTEKIWSVLKPFLKNGNAVVEPVTILNREDAAMGNYFKNRIGKLRTATERHLGEQLAEMGLEGLVAPRKLSTVYATRSRLLSPGSFSFIVCNIQIIGSVVRDTTRFLKASIRRIRNAPSNWATNGVRNCGILDLEACSSWMKSLRL